MRFCDARARRLVIASLPLLVVLIPATMAIPIMTGDDLEQAIAAVEVGGPTRESA